MDWVQSHIPHCLASALGGILGLRELNRYIEACEWILQRNAWQVLVAWLKRQPIRKVLEPLHELGETISETIYHQEEHMEASTVVSGLNSLISFNQSFGAAVQNLVDKHAALASEAQVILSGMQGAGVLPAAVANEIGAVTVDLAGVPAHVKQLSCVLGAVDKTLSEISGLLALAEPAPLVIETGAPIEGQSAGADPSLTAG